MSLLSERALRRAFRQCARREPVPGADGMTWRQVRLDSTHLLAMLARQLAGGTWRPGPLRETRIRSGTGEAVIAQVPPVLDRLVHRAMRNALEPLLDPAFPDWVAGFRPHRTRITALRQADIHRRAGSRWAARVDVAAVSEGTGVEEVIGRLADYVHDDAFLARLRTALAAMASPLAPGSCLAPMLIDLRLSHVDRLIVGLRVVRFADSYVALAGTESEAQDAVHAITAALQSQRLHPTETTGSVRADFTVEDLFLIGANR
ncbi:reverse transcriptase domain-containing protein [Actinokineospora sp.]|uniref:reverse transcriptase domain-containing protein n=1 Tax=Actinokineospora sp. TaxID=1872133 RepID=UPI004037E3A3